jgi:hypothetical protein
MDRVDRDRLILGGTKTQKNGVKSVTDLNPGVPDLGDAENDNSPARLMNTESRSMGSPRIGNWRGLAVLAVAQLLMAVPVFVVAGWIGETHWQQASLAALIVWPLVILSYVPLLVWTVADSAIVPMYLAIMVRMLGTLGVVLVVRQIAAPLVPDTCFAYISAFYLTGLVAETLLAVCHLRARPLMLGCVGRTESGRGAALERQGF